MARDPHCHWCGRELVWFDPGPKCKAFPPNFATQDHLNSRVASKPRPPRGKLVLACRECNEARAAEEERALGIAELRRRAGHNPS